MTTAGLPAPDGCLLAVETSCDETSMAVMAPDGRLLAHEIASQIDLHRPFGGVVPEVASRCHVEALPPMLHDMLDQAGIGWKALGGVAFTRGPGLATSLLTGMTAARALALRLGVPVAGVNHLHGHAVSLRLRGDRPMTDHPLPALILLVSGGHTILLREEEPARFAVLGQTLDDAAGEALDKGAKLLGLGYPGGPEIERAGEGGRPDAVAFPRGLSKADASGDRRFAFSFSGLKTALMVHLRRHPGAAETALADLAASYQEAVADALMLRVDDALDAFPARTLGCVGGVARNRRLRDKLAGAARSRNLDLRLAEPAFCTDNAAMIAASARLAARWEDPAGPDLDILPNWPLDALV